jgi:hypothetical protein
MSGKDLDRRAFFHRVLPIPRHSNSCADLPVETESAPIETIGAHTTNRRTTISALLAGVGGIFGARIARAADRFDILIRLNPKGLADRKEVEKLIGLDSSMDPLLWLEDDVSKKDRDPKTKFDIPSPSAVFESEKRVQALIQSKYKAAQDRLKSLGFIGRDIKNLGSPDGLDSSIVARHKRMKEIYDLELEANTALLPQWQALDKQMESLRKMVKEAVMFEMKVCRSEKRCANPIEGDEDVFVQVDLVGAIPNGARYKNEKMATYAEAHIPYEFKLEPYICSNANPDNLDGQSNSAILEAAKFFKVIVLRHIEAIVSREESYLQIERFSSKLDDKKEAARLKKIYTEGRKHNDDARKKWSAILDKATEILPKIAKAEFDETQAVRKMNRCDVEYSPIRPLK